MILYKTNLAFKIMPNIAHLSKLKPSRVTILKKKFELQTAFVSINISMEQTKIKTSSLVQVLPYIGADSGRLRAFKSPSMLELFFFMKFSC